MQQTFQCYRCGAQNHVGQSFCWNCQLKFQYNCPNCQSPVEGTMVNCPYCHMLLPWPVQQQNVPISVPQKHASAEDIIVSPVKGRSMIKRILLSLVPAIILGILFWFLISLTQGMEGINKVPSIWFWVGFLVFGLMLILLSGGEKIFGRFLIYLAYLFWASPIMMIAYSISSMGQTLSNKEGLAAAGAAIGGGIAGIVLIIITVIIGGFGGLILFLIGNRISKRSNKNAAKE